MKIHPSYREYRKSSGELVFIKKYGYKWNFVEGSNDQFTAPLITDNLSKLQAYNLLSDCMKNDVLEIDCQF